MRIKWTDLADVDLEKIEAHIAEENSPIVAIDVVMAVINSVDLILSEHPRAGRQVSVKNTRELVVDGAPFIIVYREQVAANCLEMLRILHDAQQWPIAE
ncbi:MAG: toxin ParE1/3/4 [Halioglobus sp.]